MAAAIEAGEALAGRLHGALQTRAPLEDLQALADEAAQLPVYVADIDTVHSLLGKAQEWLRKANHLASQVGRGKYLLASQLACQSGRWLCEGSVCSYRVTRAGRHARLGFQLCWSWHCAAWCLLSMVPAAVTPAALSQGKATPSAHALPAIQSLHRSFLERAPCHCCCCCCLALPSCSPVCLQGGTLKAMRELLHAGERLGVGVGATAALRARIRRREWEDGARKALSTKSNVVALAGRWCVPLLPAASHRPWQEEKYLFFNRRLHESSTTFFCVC